MAKQMNTLAADKKFKVYDWLKSNQERILADNLSSLEVARQCTAAMGFPVNAHNIQKIMGSQEGVAIQHVWRPAAEKQRQQKRQTDAQVVILVQVVQELCVQWGGITLPNELAVLWEGLVATVEAK